jgi:exodeoxyribonuclease X
MSKSKIIFLDTETTGNEEKDRLCQLAYKEGSNTFSQLFKPPLPISIESSAVCHITNKMVAGKPSFQDSEHYTAIKSLLESPETVLVAHNAKFDLGMLAKEDITPASFICTLRVARYLDKQNVIPRYNLQYLRYYLEMEIEAQAHDAMGDVMILEELFNRLLKKMIDETGDEDSAINKMIEVSSHPSLLHTISFGKYNGQKIKDIANTDRAYLEWLLREKLKSEADEEDWIYTLKDALGQNM